MWRCGSGPAQSSIVIDISLNPVYVNSVKKVSSKKATAATITITRGYAATKADKERLAAAGIKTIYRAYDGETLDRFKMRKGEYLGVVDGLRAFGEGRREMAAAVKLVHSWGATVIDAETGLCSRRDGVEMLHRALSPKGPSAEFAAQMQALAVRERVKGRMPKREALILWRNPRLSTKEAIELMTKWSQSAAYNQLGKRDVPAGRRSK